MAVAWVAGWMVSLMMALALAVSAMADHSEKGPRSLLRVQRKARRDIDDPFQVASCAVRAIFESHFGS